MPESAEARREKARHAALTRWANTPPAERSRKARRAFRARFENQVDPDRRLAPADRAVLVDAAIAAYFSDLRYRRIRKQDRKDTA